MCRLIAERQIATALITVNIGSIDAPNRHVTTRVIGVGRAIGIVTGVGYARLVLKYRLKTFRNARRDRSSSLICKISASWFLEEASDPKLLAVPGLRRRRRWFSRLAAERKDEQTL